MSSLYLGNDNFGKPKINYSNKISILDDIQLYAESIEKLWLSNYFVNDSNSDFHWHVYACRDEWAKRNKLEEFNRAWHNIFGN
jgi:hypothetical protein